MTETKCNIFGQVSLENMNSKQMQTCSIIWNYSSHKAGIFLCKISPVQSITNIVLLIFLFYFFVNNILFSNVYISVNTIFEYYIGHPLSTCPTEGMEGGHPRWVQVHTGGEGYHASCVPTHLQAITLFMFFS